MSVFGEDAGDGGPRQSIRLRIRLTHSSALCVTLTAWVYLSTYEPNNEFSSSRQSCSLQQGDGGVAKTHDVIHVLLGGRNGLSGETFVLELDPFWQKRLSNARITGYPGLLCIQHQRPKSRKPRGHE